MEMVSQSWNFIFLLGNLTHLDKFIPKKIADKCVWKKYSKKKKSEEKLKSEKKY